MQLELVTIQFAEPGWEFPNYNEGKYGEHKEYYWEWATGGAGIDEFMYGTMVTIFFLTPDDIKMFPHLAEFEQLAIWEDDDGGISMLHLKPGANCLICKDPLWSHRRNRHGTILCDGLL